MPHDRTPRQVVTTATPATDRRAARYAARDFLRGSCAADRSAPVSRLARVRACGFAPVGVSNAVGVRVGPAPDGARRASFSGLSTCGSTWACPVCSAKVAGERVGELGRAISAHLANGGTAAMLTLTMRHNRTDGLEALWDGLGAAWRAVTSGRAWMDDRSEFGLVGVCRVVEATHGRNGWHLHIHAVLFFDREPEAGTLPALGARLFGRWRDALRRHGFRPPSARHGIDLRMATGEGDGLAEYLAKYGSETGVLPDTSGVQSSTAEGLAMEAAGGDFKAARLGNRTPWQVLADLMTVASSRDLAVWREWEKVSRGRRRWTWTTALDEAGMWAVVLAARGDERTDEEIAVAEDEAEMVAFITADDWRTVREIRGLPAAVLLAAELDGFAGVTSALAPFGVAAWPHAPPGRHQAA